MNIFLKPFVFLLAPQRLYQICGYALPFVVLSSVMCLALGMQWGLFDSPVDYQQKDAVRIMYVHVPSAILSMAIFSMMAVWSGVFLIWRIKMFDVFAKQAAPIGLLFTVLALVTGSLWGRPMWGTWWIWDARLTSELILAFLYLAYILLDQSLPRGNQSAKLCAVLAVVGFIDIPIIHFSVQWWHTLHQGATLKLLEAPSIHPSMLKPLLMMLVGSSLLFLGLWLVKVRTALLEHFPNQFRMEGLK